MVRDGAMVEREMRRTSTSRRDLEEAMREHGGAEIAEVESARLERSGNISVVRKPAAPTSSQASS